MLQFCVPAVYVVFLLFIYETVTVLFGSRLTALNGAPLTQCKFALILVGLVTSLCITLC